MTVPVRGAIDRFLHTTSYCAMSPEEGGVEEGEDDGGSRASCPAQSKRETKTMELTRFRVQNFRSIEDSGWVALGRVTTLVGKNESGKTNLLRALRHLDPKTRPPFDELREFPRRRYHEFDADRDYSVVDAEFALSDEDQFELGQASPKFAVTKRVVVSLDFSGIRSYEFLDAAGSTLDTEAKAMDLKGVRESYLALLSAADTKKVTGYSELLRSKWSKLIPTDLTPSSRLRRRLKRLRSALDRAAANAQIKAEADAANVSLQAYEKAIELPVETESAVKRLEARMPRFIYFDVYEELENKVQLSTYVQRRKTGQLNEGDSTIRTLFELAHLDAEQLVELDQPAKDADDLARRKDQRALLVSRASIGMTGRLVEIWSQKRSTVEFTLDGDYLRLWILDERDKSRVEYEEGSKGFHWFFSFYTIFNVEAEKGHKDAILLLDEPGLHLHPSAQEDLIRILRKLSIGNQIVYTTHSPFLIDMERLAQVRIVTSPDAGGTIVSDVGAVGDPAALFPLQAAIGYSVSQSLFIGNRNLIVEGVTDYWILSTLSALFRDKGLRHIDSEIVVSPAGGARKVAYLAAMMTGQKLKVGVLYDSDREGRSSAEELIKAKLLPDRHVVCVSDVGPLLELEDLLPEQLYLDAVQDTYKKELGSTRLALGPPGPSQSIVDRVRAALLARSIQFHKSRPARFLLDAIPRSDPAQFPTEVVERIQALFDLVNQRVPSPPRSPPEGQTGAELP